VPLTNGIAIALAPQISEISPGGQLIVFPAGKGVFQNTSVNFVPGIPAVRKMMLSEVSIKFEAEICLFRLARETDISRTSFIIEPVFFRRVNEEDGWLVFTAIIIFPAQGKSPEG